MANNFAQQFGITDNTLTTLGDQSVESSSRDNILLKPESAGPCVLRFTGYIEQGLHTSNGKKFVKQGDIVKLIFEVCTPRHVTKITTDDGEKEIREEIIVTLRKGSSPKSGFMNFFKRMDYGRGNTHFVQMLGNAYRAEILHTLGDDGKPQYANIHDGQNGIYTIGAAVNVDALSGETVELAVPEAIGQIRCFLWASPNQAMWDSINIADKEDTDEKNFFKKQILSAENFDGSPIQLMLGGVDNLPGMADADANVAAGAQQAQAATAQEADDGLAALGNL